MNTEVENNGFTHIFVDNQCYANFVKQIKTHFYILVAAETSLHKEKKKKIIKRQGKGNPKHSYFTIFVKIFNERFLETLAF